MLKYKNKDIQIYYKDILARETSQRHITLIKIDNVFTTLVTCRKVTRITQSQHCKSLLLKHQWEVQKRWILK